MITRLHQLPEIELRTIGVNSYHVRQSWNSGVAFRELRALAFALCSMGSDNGVGRDMTPRASPVDLLFRLLALNHMEAIPVEKRDPITLFALVTTKLKESCFE